MASSDIALKPPTDGISSLAFSQDSSRLLVASWDGSLYLHDVSSVESAVPTPTSYNTPAAILSTTFGSTSNTAFSGGLDKRLREFDFTTGQNRVLGKHADTVQTVTWCGEINAVITGSWDKTLKVWDPRQSNPLVSTTNLPSKVYSASYAPATSTFLVSMSQRHVHVYDVRRMEKPSQERESALKFMTRSVACMVDGKGWASGSIEGRIAVEYFGSDAATQSQKYAFRCHRQTVADKDCVFPINAIAYHPIHNTFASGGSDGFISIWDHTAKKRMKQYVKYPTEVSALSFSPDGRKLAIGISYEHDNGDSGGLEDIGKTAVLIKTTVMDDCRPKSKAA